MRATAMSCSVWALILLLGSCTGDSTIKSHGPIVLGDSSTIVTETDPELLKDNVADFQPVKTIIRDTVPPVQDTASRIAALKKTDTPKAATPPVEKGLEIAFKPFTVFIPAIETRSFRQQDPANAKGVSYSLLKGKLEGNKLQVTGATVTRVVQRYQTAVILKDRNAGNMLLQSLGTYNSDWQNLRGSGGSYQLSGFSRSQLRHNTVSGSSIRNAVRKAAKSNRLSRKEEEQLLHSVRNVRSADQAPLSIVLQSVIWKITAKDAAGKTTEREVRLDINPED